MADSEEDCNRERWEVEYQEEDRHAAAIVDRHLTGNSEMDREEVRRWSWKLGEFINHRRYHSAKTGATTFLTVAKNIEPFLTDGDDKIYTPNCTARLPAIRLRLQLLVGAGRTPCTEGNLLRKTLCLIVTRTPPVSSLIGFIVGVSKQFCQNIALRM